MFRRRPGGVLPEKLVGGVRPASQTPYPFYEQNLRFSSYSIYDLVDTPAICAVKTVAADTAALNIIYEGIYWWSYQ